MALIEPSGYAHVRITVTDIERSKAFYDQVFGWPVAIDQSHAAGQEGVTDDPQQFFGGCVYQMPSGTLFGLRPSAQVGQGFESSRTGLDHVSFMLENRDALVAAADALDEAGIEHGEVLDLTGAGLAILSFQDPDDINLELTAPLG